MILDVDPVIGRQVNGPVTAQCYDVIISDEFNITVGWVTLH